MVNKIDQSQNREILEHYVQAGEIIAEMFAPYLEVIIHDLQAPEHSIIAIFNNHVTGRKIGDGTSDIGYKKLADKLPDKIVNYNNQSPSGSDLKSSSLTIRNRKDEIIGSMGFNFDLSSFANIKEFFEIFTKTVVLDDFPDREQFFMWSVRDELQQALNKYISINGLQGKVLKKEDKLKVVAFMKKEGHIKKKGAISILSDLLAITRPTLYKYIKGPSLKIDVMRLDPEPASDLVIMWNISKPVNLYFSIVDLKRVKIYNLLYGKNYKWRVLKELAGKRIKIIVEDAENKDNTDFIFVEVQEKRPTEGPTV